MPAMVDIPTGQVVTNDYAQMTLDLSTEWQAFHRPDAPELYPQAHRDEIDEVAKAVFTDVNNGVYRLRLRQAALLRGPHRHQPHPDRSRRRRARQLADPHGREDLGGRPFGDGTPPGPVSPEEQVPPGHGAGPPATSD